MSAPPFANHNRGFRQLSDKTLSNAERLIPEDWICKYNQQKNGKILCNSNIRCWIYKKKMTVPAGITSIEKCKEKLQKSIEFCNNLLQKSTETPIPEDWNEQRHLYGFPER